MYLKAITTALVGIFVCAGISHAQMTSTNYQIRWDSISAGGSDTSSSASYLLRDTVGASEANRSESATYNLDSGYRQGVFDQIISFETLIQNTSSSRLATAYAGNSISADATGISVGNYVALVQNKGAGQVSGIGKVVGVGIGTIQIDFLATAGVDPVIDGSNDYVYLLSGNELSFGSLSAASVRTSIVAFEVSAINDNGYSIQVMEDGNFRLGVETISDVADGAVTTGSEEYGARSSDTSIDGNTFDTADTAITSSLRDVVTSSSAVQNERSFLTFKASITSSTESGNYGQVLTFIASGNF
jgi:hypothetical protein